MPKRGEQGRPLDGKLLDARILRYKDHELVTGTRRPRHSSDHTNTECAIGSVDFLCLLQIDVCIFQDIRCRCSLGDGCSLGVPLPWGGHGSSTWNMPVGSRPTTLASLSPSSLINPPEAAKALRWRVGGNTSVPTAQFWRLLLSLFL